MILREEEGEVEGDCVLGVVDVVNGGGGGGGGGGGENLIMSVTLENRRPMLGWK